MVTSTHETSHRIFPDHPEVLAPVFTALGLPPPRKADIDVVTPDATELKPLERRVDTVLRVQSAEGQSFLLAIEAQTSRADEKEANWAYYVAYLRAKFELPVLLVVVCRKRTTATWAAGPFECRVGPWATQVTRPFVLGPDSVPEITDEAMVAREPAMAAFSAIVHSESKSIAAILELLAHGMRSFDEDTARYWAELLEVGLENTPARDTWKELEKMVATFFPGRGTLFEQTYLEGQAKGREEGLEEGREQGREQGLEEGFRKALKLIAQAKAEVRGEAVLHVLHARGLPVPVAVIKRISACDDPDVLGDWLTRAATVERAEDIFGADQ